MIFSQTVICELLIPVKEFLVFLSAGSSVSLGPPEEISQRDEALLPRKHSRPTSPHLRRETEQVNIMLKVIHLTRPGEGTGTLYFIINKIYTIKIAETGVLTPRS